MALHRCLTLGFGLLLSALGVALVPLGLGRVSRGRVILFFPVVKFLLLSGCSPLLSFFLFLGFVFLQDGTQVAVPELALVAPLFADEALWFGTPLQVDPCTARARAWGLAPHHPAELLVFSFFRAGRILCRWHGRGCWVGLFLTFLWLK